MILLGTNQPSHGKYKCLPFQVQYVAGKTPAFLEIHFPILALAQAVRNLRKLAS